MKIKNKWIASKIYKIYSLCVNELYAMNLITDVCDANCVANVLKYKTDNFFQNANKLNENCGYKFVNNADIMLIVAADRCENNTPQYYNAGYLSMIISDKLKNDKNFVIQVMKINYYFYEHISHELRDDMRFVFNALQYDWHIDENMTYYFIMRHASKRIQSIIGDKNIKEFTQNYTNNVSAYTNILNKICMQNQSVKIKYKSLPY